MKADALLAINQITLANEYVDPEVEWTARIFHQSCCCPAQSRFDTLFATPALGSNELRPFECIETRFSHLTETVEPLEKSSATIKRWPSLHQGNREYCIDKPMIFSLFQKAFGADPTGRRMYPSGGALYTVEVILLTGPHVRGLNSLSALHYLPQSQVFEILQDTISEKDYEHITTLSGAAFYILYCINLKKSIFKYRLRGYRFALLEVGSMYQNALLEGQNLGLSSRVIAGFSEGHMAQLCAIDTGLLLPTIIQAFGIESRIRDVTG
jgi:SagB-type dehydrogenase family enzyme